MARIIGKGYSYDDVLIVPKYNKVLSRKDVKLKTKITRNYSINIPIIAANMDTICDSKMCIALGRLGGLGILHRFMTIEKQVNEIKKIKNYGLITAAAIGVKDVKERVEALSKAGVNIVVIDIAHGHSKYAGKTLDYIKENYPKIDVMAGNIACVTPDTPILTRDLRWTSAGELSIGDKIMGFDEFPINGKRRRWKEAIVTHTGRKLKPCYKVKLITGEEIIVTNEHKWLVWDGHKRNRIWLETSWMNQHFKKGRFKASRLVRPWKEAREDKDIGYLAGIFDGEGSIQIKKQNFRISFTQNKGVVYNKVKDLLRKNGFSYHEHIKSNKQNKCFHLEIRGGFSETMRFLSQIKPLKFLNKWKETDISVLTTKITNINDRVEIISIESCGEKEIVTLSSSTETYIGKGYAMHNTKDAAEYFLSKGADAIKVGVGPGAMCTTRIMTGAGVPQITAIMDVFEATQGRIPICADGGIKKPSDVVKALGAGANNVMLGYTLAGTQETPGKIIKKGLKKYKLYQGSASYNVSLKKAKLDGRDKKSIISIEGEQTLMPYKGSIKPIIERYMGCLASGMTYIGAKEMQNIIGKADFIEISSIGHQKNHAHGVNK